MYTKHEPEADGMRETHPETYFHLSCHFQAASYQYSDIARTTWKQEYRQNQARVFPSAYRTVSLSSEAFSLRWVSRGY